MKVVRPLSSSLAGPHCNDMDNPSMLSLMGTVSMHIAHVAVGRSCELAAKTHSAALPCASKKLSVVMWLRRSGGCVTRQVEAHGALAVSLAGQGPAWQVTLRGLHCSFRPPSRRCSKAALRILFWGQG